MRGKSQVKKWLIDYLPIVIVLIIGVFYRLNSFGNPALSIGTIDTGVYIEASEEPLFSWDFFSSGRPFTVPLLYKIFEPENGYSLDVVSEPAILESTKDLHLQPGFDKVVIAQMVISIIGWSYLALAFYLILENRIIKTGCSVLILLFAYSPQLSEWDRILFSESLSFSLFALLLGLTLTMLRRISVEGKKPRKKTYIILACWAIVYALWVFTRDTNAYLTLMVIPVLVLLLLIPWSRKKIPVIPLSGILVFMVVLFSFQQRSMHDSGRWVLPFQSNLIYRVIPYPDRVEYFQEKGMPVNDDILSFTNLFTGPEYMNQSEEFSEWIFDHGTSSWMRFLLDYPLWSAQSLYHDLENLFYENLQPWYTGPDGNRPLELIFMGDYLHPKSQAVIPLIVVLTLSNLVSAITSRNRNKIVLASFLAWLLVGEAFLLYISYFGDPRSIIRHALVAVVPMRLSVWLLLMVLFDFSLSSARFEAAKERENIKNG